jgi:hypothetical protein
MHMTTVPHPTSVAAGAWACQRSSSPGFALALSACSTRSTLRTDRRAAR